MVIFVLVGTHFASNEGVPWGMSVRYLQRSAKYPENPRQSLLFFPGHSSLTHLLVTI